jgi:hypothetical protein
VSARDEWREAWRWVRRAAPLLLDWSPPDGGSLRLAHDCLRGREDGIDAVERIANRRRYVLANRRGHLWPADMRRYVLANRPYGYRWTADVHRRYCRTVLHGV